MLDKTTHTATPLTRRKLLWAIAGAAALAGRAAFAQTSKTLKIIVGSPPGALGDVLSRLIAQKLTDATGQPSIVENRPGASGAIAAGAVAKSSGDGATLLLAPDSVMVVNPFIFPKLPYDPARDFKPVALLGTATLVLVASPTLQVKTLAEFVKLAKSKPKAINFGTGGAGHPTHMTMELFRNRLGLELAHIPYKGTSPAMQDLIGGQIGVMMVGVVEAMPHIKAGTIVALAVSGPQSREVFPNLPEMKESHPDLDMSVWFGVFAPASTSRDAVATLNTEINKALQMSDVRKRLGDFGLMPLPGPPSALDGIMKTDRARFGPLVKALGITIDQ